MNIEYPLNDTLLRDLIEAHWVAFRQDGTKVYCEFPTTEDEEKESNRIRSSPGKFSSFTEGEPDRSKPLTHRKVAFFIRQLVSTRFMRLTTFAHHIAIHCNALRGSAQFPKVSKKGGEPLTIQFATEQEARKFANLALLAAVAKLA